MSTTAARTLLRVGVHRCILDNRVMTAPRQIGVPYQSHKIGEQYLIRAWDEAEVHEVAWNPERPISKQIFLVIVTQEARQLVWTTLKSEQAAHEARNKQGPKDALVAGETCQYRF